MPVTYFLYTICFILFIINVMYLKSTKHPWKSGFLGGISGVLALIPTQFLLGYFGFSFAINYLTILLSVLLGIPGVILCGIYTVFL